MDKTVEELESELEEILLNIEDIAEKVQLKKLDAFEGFTQTEEFQTQLSEIGAKLKEKGIDLTKRVVQE